MPPQSCVASVTSTLLYTLNHSGWWSIWRRGRRGVRGRRRASERCERHRGWQSAHDEAGNRTFSASSAERDMNAHAWPKSRNSNFLRMASRDSTCAVAAWCAGSHSHLTICSPRAPRHPPTHLLPAVHLQPSQSHSALTAIQPHPHRETAPPGTCCSQERAGRGGQHHHPVSPVGRAP